MRKAILAATYFCLLSSAALGAPAQGVLTGGDGVYICPSPTPQFTFCDNGLPATTSSTPKGTGQTAVSAPTAPASTSAYAMQGLAGSIKPTTTGSVLIIISGTVVSPSGTAAGNGIKYQISYGTGTAPANAATLTGTQVGTVQEYTNPATVTAADVNQPFSHAVVITGLTAGTTYWIDEAAESVATVSDMGLANVSVTAVEQ
jgi:hypothetical protein